MMHNPGSVEAIGDGCTCSSIDNNFGDGFETPAGQRFWFSPSCPVHQPRLVDVPLIGKVSAGSLALTEQLRAAGLLNETVSCTDTAQPRRRR